MVNDVRQSYTRFPNWTQPFWTAITGKPSKGETPVIMIGPWLYLLLSFWIFIAGVMTSVALVTAVAGWHLIGLFGSLSLALLGARLMVLTVAHQCAHLMFCKSTRLNHIVHDVATTLICSQDYDSYRYDHFHVHHGIKTFGTYQDPVLSFIRQLGFRETQTKSQLWRRLLVVCLSPVFHFQFLLKRVRYNFLSGRITRRLMAVAWWIWVAAFLYLRPELLVPVLVAYILPITVLYNISALLELLCEHVWMRAIGDATGRARITELSWGRFCGAQVPAGNSGLSWIRWTLASLFYHLPTRLWVLTGDAPQHDYHHIAPNNRAWPGATYARQRAIEDGKMEDREVWGLFHAIDIVFGNISVAGSNSASEYLYRIPSKGASPSRPNATLSK